MAVLQVDVEARRSVPSELWRFNDVGRELRDDGRRPRGTSSREFHELAALPTRADL